MFMCVVMFGKEIKLAYVKIIYPPPTGAQRFPGDKAGEKTHPKRDKEPIYPGC